MDSLSPFVGAFAFLVAPMGLGAFLRRRGVGVELTRKSTHLLTALACLSLPWLVSWPQLLALAIIIGALVAFLRATGRLAFLDDAQRSHASEYAFIGGVVGALALSGPDRAVFSASMLTLGTCDAAAALVGTRFGRHRYRSFAATRSLEGSAAFVLLAFLIQLAFNGAGDLVDLLFIAVTLAAVEAVTPGGFDNLTIPLSCALLGRLEPHVGGVLTLVLPLVIAGLAHQLLRRHRRLEWLAIPLDRLARRPNLFGAHKTLRGFVVTTWVSGVVFVCSSTGGAPWWLGFALGLAASLGELPNSWLKRRLGIAAGARPARCRVLFFLLDQLDSALAAALVLVAVGTGFEVVVAAVLLGAMLHAVINQVSHALRLKEVPW